MKREFYLQDDRSNKFWTVEVAGKSLITTNGRLGSKPRETRNDFESTELATRAAEKEVLSKRRKGYIEGDLKTVPEYSTKLPPRFVRINHDDYHARYVGKTADGKQFFLTFPFAVTSGSDTGGNYVALYVFDEFGLLLDANIYDERAEGLSTKTAVDEFVQKLLVSLGKHAFSDIKVAPFSVEKFGKVFGLIFDNEDEDLGAWVNVMPGDYMAFFPPWDGEYDT